MGFCAWWLAVLWGQMYVIGCLKIGQQLNIVQGQQDGPLNKWRENDYENLYNTFKYLNP